ncbi:fibronectin type III domain-containing protein [Paenibacillus sp. FSL K6-1330]|uniref:fibronectin type III domain-containing protein n=1 Tax=Paenibacillus sp. FSL K6-1330 TaxID=2975292 RepID=UPI0030DC2352
MKKITGLSIFILLFVLLDTYAYGESVKEMQGNSFPSGTIATASSVADSYIPANVIDKDLKTRWNATTYQATLQLDFPTELNISAVQLAAVATPTTDEEYTVFGFKNGLWTQISEPTIRNVLASAESTPVVLESIPVNPGNYDAIKINIDGRNSWVAINEITYINQSLNAPHLEKIVDGPISLYWNSVPGATHYEVKRSETPGGPYTTIATVQERPWLGYLDEETYNDENHYKDYYYVVTALNGSETSPNSNEVSLIRPSTPINVQAVPGDKEAMVTWDKVDNATNYEVNVATSEEGPYQYVGSAIDNNKTVTKLVNGTKYYIRVVARNEDGYSRSSSPVSVIPGINQSLNAPHLEKIVDGPISLYWNSVPGATHYEVKRSETPGGPYTTIATVQERPWLGYLDEETYNDENHYKDYYYVVTALNGSETSPNSNEVSLIRPSTPINVQAVPGDKEAMVTWDKVDNATNYEVNVATSEEGPYQYVGSAIDNNKTVTKLVNGTKYYIRVVARNEDGYSRSSSPVSVIPGINQSLNAPHLEKIVDGPISLYWNSVPGATHYEVKRSETPGGPYTTIATVQERPWLGYLDEETYNDENHYKDYYYVVTALNGSETSPNSNEVSLIRPSTPINVQAVPGDKEAMVTWDKVDNATNYEVNVATSEEGPYQYVGSAIDNNKTVTKLVNGTKYYIRVVARNEDGYSRSSSPVSIIPGIQETDSNNN